MILQKIIDDIIIIQGGLLLHNSSLVGILQQGKKCINIWYKGKETEEMIT